MGSVVLDEIEYYFHVGTYGRTFLHENEQLFNIMKKLFTGITLLLISITALPQAKVYYKTIPDEYKEYIYAKPKDVQWFRDAKFGVFVHWGPYVLAEVPASWGRLGPRPGAGKQAKSGVPQKEYDNLYKKFNPVDFNADEWIKMVKDAGAKYFIFTTKHHDGFCMFDAHNTDYKITNTPFGRDVAKEIADACHKYSIKLFWYYSEPDWHHPDCLTENNERYRDYMYEHLKQLLTGYGKVDGIFFDGLGTKYYDWDTPRMLKMIRTLQPGIVINRRWGAGMPGIKNNGDYDTPEQQIGVFQIDRPWETCATIAEAWSWTGAKHVKTYETNQRLLIQCSISGGNLALNTGPKPDGTINQPEKDIYLKIGQWLNHNGESIYATTGGPYKPGPWGGATRKGNTVYLHILTAFAPGASKEIVLPALTQKIVKSYSLTGAGVAVKQTKNSVIVSLEGNDINTLDNIVVLETDNNTNNIEPIETFSEKNIIPVTAIDASSNGSKKNSTEALLNKSKANFVEGKHFKAWWSAKKGDSKPWIAVEFSKPQTFNYISLAEQIRNCAVRSFVLEYDDNGKWKTLYKGSQIGMDFSVKVPVTKTQKVRLKVLKTNQNYSPDISKFDVIKL